MLAARNHTPADHQRTTRVGSVLRRGGRAMLVTTRQVLKATHMGTIFDGLVDCYVLEDGRRAALVEGSDIVCAFINGRSRGTLDTIRKAFAAGKVVYLSIDGANLHRADSMPQCLLERL